MISKSALKSGGVTVLSSLVTYILVRGVIEICELSFTLGKTVYKNRKKTSFPRKEEKVFDNLENCQQKNNRNCSPNSMLELLQKK